MVLRSTNTLVLYTDAGDMTPSLPDPATVTGRVHWLVNAATASTTWSSSGGGGNPFTESGGNGPTCSVGAGQVKFVRSDGVRWQVLVTLGSRRVFSATDVTDGAGNAVFTFTPAFPTVPIAVAQVGPSGDVALVEARVTALTASGCTVNVRRAPSVSVLGIALVSFPGPAAGAPVQLIAIEAGQGV